MRKIFIFILLLSVIVFSGCGTSGNTKPDAASLPSPAAPSGASLDEQRAFIEASRDIWEMVGTYGPWHYAITDLDHNGRLEIISACTQGTGVFTTAEFRELSESFDSLVRCNDHTEEFSPYPEIVISQADCYYDSENAQYWYIFDDLTKNGYAEQYISITALSLKDGQIYARHIAHKEIFYSDPEQEPKISCRDEFGNTITEADFYTAAERTFAGLEKSTLSLEWTRIDASPGEQQFTAPESGEQPLYSGPAPVITKNPTSESLSVGGRTWFIAHADNADGITWLFVSPSGQQYGLEETLAFHAGLSLEVLPEDTLAVSNVPASFNGWGIQARFDGPGGYTLSDTACVSVDNFAAAYEPVIEEYRTAYTSGNANANYAVENGLSYLINYIDALGYAMKDIDKNGVPELIIAPISGDYIDPRMIVELYTLVDGQPVKLCESMERSRFYLLPDNSIYYEGSGGAAYQIYELLNLDSFTLKFIEGYSSSNSSDLSGSVFYHTKEIKAQFDGVWGDYDRYDMTGSREAVESMMNSIRQNIWMPDLTAIN